MLTLRAFRHSALFSVLLAMGLSLPGHAEDDVAPDAPAAGAVQAAAPDPATSLAGELPIPLAAGDVALTGFPGVTLATPTLPAGVDPLEKTVIDPAGVALRILDLTNLGGPPLGQVLNPPVKLAVPARDIGQVFALAFDDGGGAAGTGVPNLYAAATSLYGLQIVGDPAEDGSVTRLKAGDPRARFMDAQFGSLPGAGPGAIWRIDGTTGAVTHLADTAFSGVLNSGPGIGDLAFDPQSRNLYASDLDTGLIHRFDLEHNAADLGQFDHGMSGRPGAELPSLADDGARADILSPAFHADDPATWGFTQPERRVEALAVHDGRLYYSVADGPTIWSVALQPDGSFDITARLELAVDAEQPFHVTDIVFDEQGRMILAQRATQQSPFDYGQFTAGNAQTLRYTPAGPEDGANLWVPDPEEYPIGLPDGNRQVSGGITLFKAFNPDGTLGSSCKATLITTGDDLRDNPALAAQLPRGPSDLHGIQINDASLTLPLNVPPVATAFAAFDPAQADPAARGHVGDVEAVPCVGAPSGTDSGLLGPEPGFAEAGPGFSGPIFPDGVPPVLVPLPEGGFGAGLTLSKFPLVESCTEDGGCAFVITVHNPGPDPFPGPFAINDVFTDSTGGPLAGAKLTSPPDPAWECSPDLPLTCVHPDPLPVGDTTLDLTFAPGDLGGLDDVVNCVLPVDPDNPAGALDDGDPANPAPQPAPVVAPPPLPVVSDKNGLKVAVNPKVPNCSALNGGCDFEVALTNTGQTPVKGPLTFVLKATLGADPAQAVIDGTPVSLPAGFACQPKNDGEGARVECTNNAVDIAAGQTQSLTFSLKAKVPADSNAGSITARVDLTVGNLDGTASNSIAFNDAPAKGPPAQAGAQGADGAPFEGEHLEDRLPPQQCAHIAVEPAKDQAGGGKDDGKGDGKDDGLPKDPVKANGLTFSKTPAEGVASCADDATCRFTVHVKNDSGAEVKGPIVITDAVQANNIFFGSTTISTAPTPPWKCVKKGQTFQCTHPGPIAAGASADFTVGFRIDSGQAINEIENCITVNPADPQKTCAAVPVAKPAPPANIGQLKLAKVRNIDQCSDVGGGCDFVISVTNPGPDPFEGKLVINDTVTVDGKNAPFTIEGTPQAIEQPGVTAPIGCSSKGDHIQCSGDVKLPAGKTITLPIGIRIGTNTGGKQIENCVAVDGVADKPCAAIPLTRGGPLLKPMKFTAAHSCTPSCTFGITIQNIGTGPTTGPISFEDVMTSATASTTITVVDGDFACSTVAAAPPRLVCITKKGTPPLQPGQAIGGRVTISGLPDNVPSYLNCVRNVTTPGAKPGENAPVAIGQRNCVTVPNDAPKKPHLKIEKQPPNAGADGVGHCGLDEICRFTIVVTNDGTAPWTSDITVADMLQNGTVKSLSLGGGSGPLPVDLHFRTGGGIGFFIRVGPNTPLRPGDSTRVEVDMVAGSNMHAKGNTVVNCAGFNRSVISPGVSSEPSCATVKLDPFDVKVTKTADDAACAPGGECHFTIDLFDPGPIPHDAPVTISDKLDAGTARIASITPASGRPFPCAALPTQIPFTCTSPGDYPLQVGEHVKFQMTVVMPADARAEKFVNCATVAPYRSEAGSADASTACATVTAKPPEKPVSTPVSCFANMVADAAGNCACPAGTEWNGKDCGSGGAYGVLPTCPTGTQGTPPDCKAVAAPPCPAGTTGTYPDCKVVRTNPVPPPASKPTTKPTPKPTTGSGGWNGTAPTCPPGTHGVYPACRPDRPTKAEPKPTCPPGTRGVYPKCRPDRKADPRPQCPAGTHPVGRRCRPDRVQPTQQCANGMVGTYPDCRCPEGTRYSRSDRSCVAVEKEKRRACPEGTYGRYPRCRPLHTDDGTGGSNGTKGGADSCPLGMTGRPPNCCPPGTRPTRSGQCVAPEPQKTQEPKKQEPATEGGRRTCGRGMIGRPPHCRCPAGKYLNSGARRCLPGAPKTKTEEPDDRIDYGGSAGGGTKTDDVIVK